MTKYDIIQEQQKALKVEFLASKTPKEIENIKPLISKFLKCKELTKVEYNNLYKYFTNIDILDQLTYNSYKACNFTHMNYKDNRIHDIIVRACFILN